MTSGVLLVTGANGFIGRHLVRSMLDAGRHVVVGLRRAAAPGSPLAGVPWIDLGVDQPRLRSALKEHGITSCAHLAARFVAEHDAGDVADLVASNVGLTAALADAAAAAGATQFLAMGTVWQNAAGPGYRPVSLYAATKQAAEDVLQHFLFNEELPVSVLKLPDTYGPGDTRRKALDLLLDAARTGSSLDMSPGEQLLDLVHVRDVVGAINTVLSTPAEQAPGTWVLSSGKPLTLSALADRVATVTGRPVHVTWGARPYRRVEAFRPWDAGPLLPGWTPRMSLDDGIAELWQERTSR